MPMPPMNNEAIFIKEDRTQPPDRYGKYPTTEVKTKARVKFTSKVIRQPDGTERQAILEVDLPPMTLEQGLQIKAKDSFNVWHTAEIISVADATNFAGNRLYYRTVLCD